ncbi:MAG: ATP-dependent DNA ligase [Nanoarchaeota archaeon]|nr:ATP-dependent DNA ligase [Nanoarchaeota archaeon]
MEKLIIGQPVEPMLVSESGNGEKRYSEILKAHNGKSYAQIKSDGYRVQVHNNGDLKMFTRGLNEFNPAAFPDIIQQLGGIPHGIFDGELVGVEDGIKGFNAIKARKRESLDTDLVRQYPLQIKFFDALNLEGKDLIHLPLYERRQFLKNYFDNLSEQWEISSAEALEERYKHVTDVLGLEGLVCKNPSSEYLIGKKTKDWIKLKKFLTLDLVVLGVYDGEGKASKHPFAALLLGTKNNGYYETITKVGIAKKDIIEDIQRKISSAYTDKIPDNVVISDAINKRSYSGKRPDRYVLPEKSAVVEVETLNVTRSDNWHSCGLNNGKAYSLRIPIVQKYREDKKPCDATTTQQIREIFEGS